MIEWTRINRMGGLAIDQISLCVMTRELCHQLYQGWENDPAIYMDMGQFSP